MDSPSPLDVEDIEQMSAVIPSDDKASPESKAAPMPSTSSSPNHALVADLPPATTLSPKGPAKRTFAAIAKKVIIQERIRKAEEEEAADGDEDEEPEEDLTLEQLEEKAQAGDARAQTQLGQHHLLVAEERDPELNNGLAVRWLLKAAKQGRRGAARLLQRCWVQNKGISPENADEVRRLSTESRFELAVRKAAMLMYWKLNPERKAKVAMTEMLQNVSQVNTKPGGVPGPTTGQTQKILQSMVSNRSQDLVDLDDFVEITKQFAQGMAAPPRPTPQDSNRESPDPLPEPQRKSSKGSWGLAQGGMMLNSRRSGALFKVMALKSNFMMLQYPLHVVMDLKEHLVDWASRAGVQWLSTLIPTQHVNALIFFFIISNLTVDLFAFVIPLLVFYLSFIAMIFCTLRVFQRSKTWVNFSTITALLTRFEPELDVEQAESNFSWNNLEPQLYFILSVFFVIFSFPVADKIWIPCSELSTVAIFFFVISYMSLSPAAATYARRAMVIEVASSLCYLTRFLPEKMAIRILGRTFATLPLGESVVLKLSLPCLLYVYLFYLFFSMARSRGFRGTYCFLVPYLVCFLWWEFSVVLLQHSSIIGLIRTCVAYFLLLFALPVLAFGLALMLLIQMAKWFLELQLTKVVVTLALCAVPVSLRLWTRFSLSILDVLRSLTHGGAVKLILVCVSMGILFFGMYVYHSEGLKAYNSTLTWGQYSQLCGPPAWQSRGMAQTQMFCSHLEGHRVTWNGRFKQMRLADMENGPQSVINVLPVFMGDWLRCLYGEAYPKCETRNAAPVNATLVNATPVHATPVHATPVNAAPVHTTLVNATPVHTAPVHAAPPPPPQGSPVVLRTQEEEELCQMKAVAKHACHVKRFDSFLFEVTVGQVPGEGGGALDPTHDIVLKASHEFKQVLLNLEPGNVVEFSTKLEGGLGAKAPSFELRAIHCLDCSASPLAGGRQVKLERNWRRNTLEAVKFAFDFFFSPLLFAKINV